MNNHINPIFCLLLIFLSSPLFSNNLTNTKKAYFAASKKMIFGERILANQTECPKRKKYCQGTRSWSDGAVYSGEFRFGEPHGTGKYQWKDGSSYEGHFIDGYRHGKGSQLLENGDTYEGEWQFGLMHGEGTYVWEDGSKYVGEFYEGLMHGKGNIKLANGEVYEGEWKDGLAHGDGTFNRIDGSKFIGKSKDGQRHGKGVISWRTGDTFTGTWKNGKVNKEGTFQFSNGDKYHCNWEAGILTADASYVFENGKVIPGDLQTIERSTINDSELFEAISNNLGLVWYTVALEYKVMQRYNKAAEILRTAQKYVTSSSDLNKLIHQQLAIVNEKTNEDEL